MTSPPIVYRVDATDRIVWVNDAWNAFALQNDGAAAMATQVLGRRLWDFISGLETCMIYRRVLARVREGTELRFGFRCDAPSYRRAMEMLISRPDGSGGVEFRSVTAAENHRQPPNSQMDEALLQRMCGWCNRFDVGGTWMELEEALPRLRLMVIAKPRVTHGMCESCFAKMAAELDGP